MGRRGRIQREMMLQTEAAPSFSRSRATLAISVLGQAISVDLDDIEGCEVPLVVSPRERHLLFGLLFFHVRDLPTASFAAAIAIAISIDDAAERARIPHQYSFWSCTAVGIWKRSCNCTYNVLDITTPG
jgi:hypothetical protein